MKYIYAEDFGAVPNSGKDALPAINAAINAARALGEECEIVMSQGIYDIFHHELNTLDIYISNTHSEEESPSFERHFALLFKDCRKITFNGCGAVIRLHGKMTIAGIVDSSDITLKNLSFTTPHPMLTEMTVISMENGRMDCRVHPDSLYRINDGKIEWYGENFAFSKGISQLFDPVSGITWRAFSPMQDENAVWEELKKGIVRVNFRQEEGKDNPYSARVGYVFQMRDPLRDETGVLISESKDITVKNVTVDYMNCMGFMVQNSENVTVDGFNALPTGGRTAANSSDAMHISGCRGKLTVKNCHFCGAHDDAINIHGTHLIVTEHDVSGITLKFMHPQTFGIGGFKVGDRIAAVNPETLLRQGEATVTSVIELTPREIRLEITGDRQFFTQGIAVENISALPDAEITDNYFDRIPTRGILVTTGGKVVIRNNIFNCVKGCGVLIADDAKSWYESGPVFDVTVEGNVFKSSGGPFVCIAPENSVHAGAVHKNITVCDNDIFVQRNDNEIFARINPWTVRKTDIVADIKSTDGFVFANNRIYSEEKKCFIKTKYCKAVKVVGNSFDGSLVTEEQS